MPYTANELSTSDLINKYVNSKIENFNKIFPFFENILFTKINLVIL